MPPLRTRGIKLRSALRYFEVTRVLRTSRITRVAAAISIPLAGMRGTFVPDWTFKGSTLAGWKAIGQADWRAVDGELDVRPAECVR